MSAGRTIRNYPHYLPVPLPPELLGILRIDSRGRLRTRTEIVQRGMQSTSLILSHLHIECSIVGKDDKLFDESS